MNINLSERMTALRGRYDELNELAQRRRNSLLDKGEYIEAYRHPDVLAIMKESARLFSEMANLGCILIRENIARFGIDDPQATARLEIMAGYSGPVVRTVEVRTDLLSNLCQKFCFWPKPELDKSVDEVIRLSVPIFFGSERIGYVDSSGEFSFTAAPNLRVCVGWAMVSRHGRQKTLLDYDLDREVSKLEHAIKAAPSVDGSDEEALKEYFFGAWKRAVEEAMRYRHGCFIDGHYEVTTMFWQVATRTIRGREHPAFRSSART